MKQNWNHNIHYHSVILKSVPQNCATALDVGCGEGILTRQLSNVCKQVTGIDLHVPSVEIAKDKGGEGISYVVDDFFTHPFEPESFDFISSVAVLHHLPAEQALKRMADLLKPGGSLVIVGLARSHILKDLPFILAGTFMTRFHRYVLGKKLWEHSSPQVWPPPLSFSQMRRLSKSVLPGSAFRHHVLWRYTLVWKKP